MDEFARIRFTQIEFIVDAGFLYLRTSQIDAFGRLRHLTIDLSKPFVIFIYVP